MREVIREILNYEYEKGLFGLQSGELTPSIIEAEVKRYTKHNNPEIYPDKIYTVTVGNKSFVVIEHKDESEADEYMNKSLETIYKISGDKIID